MRRPRPGVVASATAHAAVIVVALVGFNHASELKPDPVESISVDLVPVTDTANVRTGSEQSKVVDTPAPSTVDSPTPADPPTQG